MSNQGPNGHFDRLRLFKKYLRRLSRAKNQQQPGLPRQRFLQTRIDKLAHRLNPLRNVQRAATLATISASILLGGEAQAQVPKVTALAPASNANSIAVTSNVAMTFSTAMTVSSLTAGNIRIFGSQTGFLSNTGVFSGNPVRSFNPTNNFKAGERIFVTVTGASSTAGNQLATPLVYDFLTAPSAGSAVFNTGGFGGSVRADDVAFGDLDGDGNLDAFVSGNSNQIWFGNGDGTFSSSNFGGRSQSVGLGDLDGDGDLDAVLIVSPSDVQVHLNNGDATFASSTISLGADGASIAIADMDGDGDLDVIVAANNIGTDAPNSILFNNGNGNFVVQTFGSDDSNTLDVGDIDTDGDIDVLVGNDGSAVAYFNNADGSFTSSTVGAFLSFGLALGDLDADGDLDLVASRYSGVLTIGLNNGSGSFAVTTLPSSKAAAAELGDLDADGDLDIIIANTGNEANDLWLNNGDATFVLQSQIGAGSISGIAIGDIDNDGDLDAILANTNNAPNEIWLNQQAPQILSANPNCVIASATAQTLVLSGIDLTVTSAQITVLDNGGNPVGSVTMATTQNSPQSFTVTIPAGGISTTGSLTLTAMTPLGQTSAILTIEPGINISGTTASCSNEILSYQALPSVSGASVNWTVTGGTILSGLGSEQVEVQWDAGSTGVLNASRSYISGCITSANFSAGSVDLIDAVADVASSTDGTVTTNVLNNELDDGALDYRENVKDGLGGVDGLNGAYMVALSPTSQYAYVPGSQDNSVAVLFRNRIPLAAEDMAIAFSGSTSVFDVLINDIDNDDHDLTISAKTDGTLGTVTITGGGSTLTYAPGGSIGPDTFTYTVEDSFGGSSTATVSVLGDINKSGDANANSRTGNHQNELNVRLAPNPVGAETTIQFNIPFEATVRLELSDVNGRRVSGIRNQLFKAGEHSLNWQTRIKNGATLATGAYLLTVEAVNASGRTLRQLVPVTISD